MRQAEAPPNSKWIGRAEGGVKAPAPIVLADPAKRFAQTAKRLEALAGGHPMEAWLRFMARLSQAQHSVATTFAPGATLESAAVQQAIDARLPPLAADGHRRDPSWREGLARLLDSVDSRDLPSPARAAIVVLRYKDPSELDALADDFLRGSVDEFDTGLTLYVTAALQVYFVGSAARLHAPTLRLLEERGLCPCCGSPPVSGLITASGDSPGTRYLQCSLCGTAWNHVRALCITCGGSRKLSLYGVEGDTGVVKAEACGECDTYSKMLYQAQDMQADPVADDLASLGLDMLVAEAGFARHAANPFLLVG